MLENVLDDYLANLRDERAFDAPFLALLPALGFFDIHYTHGTAEFGKDFIAKRREGRKIVQYSFQSKRDVTQSNWREIQNQLLEAVLTPLSHPQFDSNVPHQPVLVVTGRVSGNASLGGANFNNKLRHLNMNALPLLWWDRSNLIHLLAKRGLAGVHRTSAQGFQAYGRFYALYGDAIEGQLTPRSIERYSRNWLLIPSIKTAVHATNNKTTCKQTIAQTQHRLLLAALESAMLAERSRAVESYYEALYCHLASWRAVLHAWHCSKESDNSVIAAHCHKLHDQIRPMVQAAALEYINWVEGLWREAGCCIASCIGVPADGMPTSLILSAPVHCLRFVETLGLYFGLADSQVERERIVTLLEEFVRTEPNCAHPIAERHAVSLVWPIISLKQSGYASLAREWILRTAVWLCDRHELGVGLAHLEANAEDEAVTLLGSSFEFIPVSRARGSLLATILVDLAAWLGETDLYKDLLNDFEAVGIRPHFYQLQDSEGVFRFEAPDVVMHPNVIYNKELLPFEDRCFATHLKREPSRFLLSDKAGLEAFAGISLLLRDRYFSGLWPL